MMKIYINEKPLLLIPMQSYATFPKTSNTLTGIYRGKVKLLHQFIDTFEKNNPYDAGIIAAENYEQLVDDFKGLFKNIAAAGGVVYNADGNILMIFRRSFWDLPKGKIDKGESEPAAAVREVQEETGIQNIVLGDFITTTYHIYTLKEKRILKPTYWYKMTTTDIDLTPQTEEDIEQAIWWEKDNFFSEKRPIYKNIVEVLSKC